MKDQALQTTLDANLAALIVLAIVAIISLAFAYCATVVKYPRLLSDFVKCIGKIADVVRGFLG